MSKSNTGSRPLVRGGAKKNLKQFARIIDYVEGHHPKLYEIIDDMGAQSYLIPKRGNGITFLMPDTSYISQMRKLADDSLEEAYDMFLSLIIPMNLATAKDWAVAKDDIPNMLGKKIEVSAVGSDKITLANKSVITENKKFKPVGRVGKATRGNMFVWDLSGKIEIDNAPESNRKQGGASKSKKPGQRKYGGDNERSDIQAFVKYITNREKQAYDSKPVEQPPKSIILNVLVNYCKIVKSDSRFSNHYALFCDVYNPKCCGSIEATFHILMCCQGFLDDGLTREIIYGDAAFTDKVEPEKSRLLATVQKPVSVLRAAVSGNVDTEIRKKLKTMNRAVTPKTSRALQELYKKQIITSKKYKLYADKNEGWKYKLMFDEFAFTVCTLFELKVVKGTEINSGDAASNYSEYLQNLGEIWGYPHVRLNNPESVSMVLGKNGNVEWNDEKKLWLEGFLESGCIFKTSCSISGGNQEGECVDDYEHDSDETEVQISATAIQELQNYIDAHGKLPDSIKLPSD